MANLEGRPLPQERRRYEYSIEIMEAPEVGCGPRHEMGDTCACQNPRDPDGITTEVFRCPNPVSQVVAKITRGRVG